MMNDPESELKHLEAELQRIGKVAPKFTFNQEVQCKFRGKRVTGMIITCDGHYFRDEIMKYENKYGVQVPGTDRLQRKWEHELEASYPHD